MAVTGEAARPGRTRSLDRRRPAWGLPALNLRHPAQYTVTAFAAAVSVGTLLLMLPIARAGRGGATFLEALFTATSAVCVTGHIVVDTPRYWSGFGHVVILGLVQVGGFGIMTFASMLGLAISHRLDLRSRLTAAAEVRHTGMGDLGTVLFGVARITFAVEGAVAVVLAVRFAVGYGESPLRALYLGAFHAVSAFNNAGFALYSDNLVGFAADPWIMLPICTAVIIGGIGFPVIFELLRERRRVRRLSPGVPAAGRRVRSPLRLSLHTRITLATTGVLLLAGSVYITANEWTNPGTLGPMGVAAKVLAGFTQAVMPRTAGFNSVDIADMDPSTWLAIDALMFIGGGSASTAGGIKVTTFALLFFAIIAEVRGERNVNVYDRRIPPAAQRTALTVALLSVALVVVSTLVLVRITDFTLDQVLLEVISAFSTVGLSTGITAQLPAAGQVILILLMFIGRLGPVTLASALALRENDRAYALPEARPIIG